MSLTRLTLLALALWLAGPLQAAPVVVQTPNLTCPETELGDDALQARYDEMWEKFSEDVDQANKKLQAEIEKEEAAAKASGNLNLVLFWQSRAKEFGNKGGLKWDDSALKKTWKQQYGDTPFPASFTTAAKKASGGFQSAQRGLETGYTDLVTELTKAGNVPQALKVRDEMKALLGEKNAASAEPEKKQRTPQELARLLRGTRWKNTNNFFFQWDDDGKLWHIHNDAPNDPAEMRVKYTSGTTCDFFFVRNSAKQKIVFDEDLKTFKQLTEDEQKVLCTAVRIR